jgi:hypothetical protein
MPLDLDFLRGVVGALCVFFAFMAGRSAVAVRKGGKLSRLYGWLIRTLLCAAVVVFRRTIDTTVIAVWGCTLVAFAAGFWQAAQPKNSEDASREIFPE